MFPAVVLSMVDVPPIVKVLPDPLAPVPAPSADEVVVPDAPLLMFNCPAFKVTPPLKVLAPESVQVPAWALVTEVAPDELSTITPEIVFAPVLAPCSVKVLPPTPEAVKAVEKVRAPLPSF